GGGAGTPCTRAEGSRHPTDCRPQLRPRRSRSARRALPRQADAATSWASTYGALQLADGTRVPWLTVSVEEANAGAKAVPEKTWLAGAKDAIDDMRMTWGKRPERTTTGDWWLKFPCRGDEVFWVVTTGVFFEAAGTHIFAMREKQLLEETLP